MLMRISRKIRSLYRRKYPAIVSFPKSGRTWIRVMLDQLKVKCIYTHGGADTGFGRYWMALDVDKQILRHSYIIFLSRDPLDTVVSGFFHASKRLKIYDGAISDYIRDGRYGIEKIVKFNNMWLDYAAEYENFYATSYERLRADTNGEIIKLLYFLDVTRAPFEIERAIEMGSFENMQRLERLAGYDTYYGDILRPGNPQDPESFKVRKGVIGGFRKYLSHDDINYCKCILAKCGHLGDNYSNKQVGEQNF